MLRLHNLTKYFNKGTPSQVLALDHINLELKEQESLVIVGSNGSGKSTLLDLVAGNYFADEGTILMDGTDVTRRRDYERTKWVARVFQDPLKGTASDLTIIENFRLASLRKHAKGFRIGINSGFRKSVKEKIATLHLGMENKLDSMVGTLSGGQRQALTLLMSTIDQPEILLLDEPTAALDPRSSQLVINLAEQVIRYQNLTAVLVTHNLKYAVQFGSRLIMMDQGKILKDFSGDKKGQLSLQEIQNWFL